MCPEMVFLVVVTDMSQCQMLEWNSKGLCYGSCVEISDSSNDSAMEWPLTRCELVHLLRGGR